MKKEYNNNFKANHFISVLLVCVVISLGISIAVCSLAYSVDPLLKSDYMSVLPINKSYSIHSIPFKELFLNLLTNNYYTILILSSLMVLLGLFGIVIIFKKFKIKSILHFAVIVLLVSGLLYQAFKCFYWIVLNNVINISAFKFLVELLLIFIPLLCLLFGTMYLIISNTKNRFIYLFALILSIFAFSYDYYLQTHFIKLDLNNNISNTVGIEKLKDKPPHKTYYIIMSNGEIKPLKIDNNYNNIALTENNWKILLNRSINKTSFFIDEEMYNLATRYYTHNLNPNKFRGYLLNIYVQKPNYINAINLFRSIKSYSNLENIVPKILNEYTKQENYITKEAYGVMAIFLWHNSNFKKSEEFWQKYVLSKQYSNKNSKLISWINQSWINKRIITSYKGKLLYKNKPVSNAKIVLIKKSIIKYINHENNDTFYSSFMNQILDYTQTKTNGSFELKTFECLPTTIIIDIGKNENFKYIPQVKELIKYKCGKLNNIGIIKLQPVENKNGR